MGSAAAAGALALVQNSRATTASGAEFVACGEYVRRANSHMKSIVSTIDDVWGAHVRVYQSVAMLPPHARPGGCVMYNPAYLRLLLEHLMIRDSAVVDAMLYAIMAHEVGHEMHDDFSPQRAALPSETRELEADRFAGYTMQRLNLGLDNITPYYSLAGDEFTGAMTRPSSRHGESMRRTNALRKGWELGEWNQPEDYHSLSDDD